MSSDLTAREQIAFDLLKKGPATTEDIKAACESNSIEIKTNHAIVLMLKYLSAKVSQEGWIISNSGGIGRGRHGKYEMEKKF
jgi:hypothetical protein